MFKTIEEAVEAVQSGQAVLIDVRTHAERRMHATVDAQHLELAAIEAGADPDHAKDHPILIHCRSGGRAGMACSILQSRGFTNVHNVGGLNDWLAASGEAA